MLMYRSNKKKEAGNDLLTLSGHHSSFLYWPSPYETAMRYFFIWKRLRKQPTDLWKLLYWLKLGLNAPGNWLLFPDRTNSCGSCLGSEWMVHFFYNWNKVHVSETRSKCPFRQNEMHSVGVNENIGMWCDGTGGFVLFLCLGELKVLSSIFSPSLGSVFLKVVQTVSLCTSECCPAISAPWPETKRLSYSKGATQLKNFTLVFIYLLSNPPFRPEIISGITWMCSTS